MVSLIVLLLTLIGHDMVLLYNTENHYIKTVYYINYKQLQIISTHLGIRLCDQVAKLVN